MVLFQFISNIIQIYSIILVIYALLSWFPGAPESALGQMVHRLVEPFLSLFKKLPLQFAGLDFTVLVAILLLNFLERLVAQLFLLKEIYQHFHPEDHEFIDRCIELSERVIERYSVEVTSFLNPHQVTILRNVAASYPLQVFVSSDDRKMEYAKVIVAPDYYQLDPSDFDLSLLEITYSSKFHQLTHSQVWRYFDG